jgi:transposase-like protein
VHSRADRRLPGRQEGADRLPRWRARDRAGLARAAARPEAARLGRAAQAGALGFWKALGEVWPKTREQRCWVHKTANVLNKLPKGQQPKARRALQEIWMAETKAEATIAFEAFIEACAVKYDKAIACLAKDRDALLAFYDFPAEHCWTAE